MMRILNAAPYLQVIILKNFGVPRSMNTNFLGFGIEVLTSPPLMGILAH